MKNNDDYNTSTARIKLPRKVSEPIYIDLRELEAIREVEQAKRCKRIEIFQSHGW